MNRARLSKSGIEYLDYQWGIFSGSFEPTFYPEALLSPLSLRTPSRIGVAWVGDIIGYGMDYKEDIYRIIEACPQHTFLFLTKNPDNLTHWSPFPSNCWVGVTATNSDSYKLAKWHLDRIDAKVKFLSLEPLLESVGMSPPIGIDWFIIGGQTKPTRLPQLEWVRDLLYLADRYSIPVYLKNNLDKLLNPNDNFWAFGLNLTGGYSIRQEVPE